MTTNPIDGMGDWEILLTFAILLPFVIGFFGKITGNIFSSKALLILQSLTVKRHNIEEGVMIEISGRRTGIISTLVSIIGFEGRYHLKVFNDITEFEETNLSGNKRTIIPNGSIVKISQGYYRPVFKLFMCLLFSVFLLILFGVFIKSNDPGEFINGAFNLLGVTMPVLGSLIISTVGFCFFLLTYIFGKSIQISIGNGEGNYGFAFKRGVLEGVRIDIFKLEQAVICYKEIVMKARKEEAVLPYIKSKKSDIVDTNKDVNTKKNAPKQGPFS